MKNVLEFTGVWYLPTSPEEKMFGILKYIGSGYTLQLYGGFHNHPEPYTDIIIGIVGTDTLVTLYSCSLSTWSGKVTIYGDEMINPYSSGATYKIEYILEGAHFDTVEALQFNLISSEITFLDEWVNINGFKEINYDFANSEAWINYQKPKPISFLADELNGKLEFSVIPPTVSYHQFKSEVQQKVRLNLSAEKSISLMEALYSLRKFQNFLSLSFQTHTTLKNVTLKSSFIFRETTSYVDKKAVKRKIYKTIKLYFISRKEVLDNKAKMEHDMLFTYSDIKENFSNIINNWYSKYTLLEPSFNLLIEQFYSIEKITENVFLSLAQALETFHARLHPSEKVHLSIRIKSIVDTYAGGFVLKSLGDYDNFLIDFMNSRNYYTHYNLKKKEKALTGIDLVKLINKSTLLLISAFLIEIGVDSQRLDAMLEEKGNRLYFLLSS